LSDVSVNIGKIEEVIAAAKARKAEREAGMGDPVKEKISKEDRSARKEQMLSEREARKASRAEKPVKLKVKKTAPDLSPLIGPMEATYSEITSNFNQSQITSLVQHLQRHNRLRSVEMSASSPVKEGMNVKIVNGDPKFIGMTGTVTESRRIRCFVNVPGAKKPVYCFTSDVEPIND
jgi:hypothetical protein